MAQRDFYLTLGQDLVSATGNNWQIAGIAIDNPSGSWLLVEGINQTVPPYVKGWTYPVTPSQLNISVRFVDSPSGSLSQLVGGQPHVILYDQPVPISAGFPSGAGARVTIVPRFKTIAGLVVTNGPPGTTILTATGVDIVIRVLGVSYGLVAIPPAAINGSCGITWGDTGPGLFWLQTISPEMPSVESRIEDGAWILPNGTSLIATGVYENGGAIQRIYAQVQYYELASS